MTDEKNPLDQALDVFVYAPLGLVFSARELLPKLAEKGRSQFGMAKMIGQFAVQQGSTEANRAFGKARDQALSTLEQLAGFNGSTAAATNGAAAPAKPAAPAASKAPSAPAVATSGPEAATLAIPDYDSLSASQVLPRLQGLAPGDLEAVRAYEAAHRGRKTILNRVTQLQAE